MTNASSAREHAQRLTECPACGSSDLRSHLSGYDFHYGNPGEFTFERCSSCALWILSPMPRPAQLASFYPQEYYAFQAPAAERAWKRGLKRALGLTRTTYLPRATSPGRLLDVGCGAGHYLKELARRGWQVAGIEPSEVAASTARAAGLDVHLGDLSSAPYPPASFDVVRFNHSFEHVANPRATLEAAHRLLTPDGYLFVGVPNTSGLWARLFGRWWWYFGVPVHTFGYNSTNLLRLMERAGFRVERVVYNAEFAGLLGSLQIWANRRISPRRSTGPILSSLALRLPALWVSRLLDLLRQGDCIEVIARPTRRNRDQELAG